MKRAILGVATLTLMLAIAAGDAAAANARVWATGRFGFLHPVSGAFTGIRDARVEMCDEDGWPFGCVVFAESGTGYDGSFGLGGSSGDWFGDLPEVEIRVYTRSNGVEVSNGVSVYCFKTPTRQNVADGATVDFGYIAPHRGFKCTFGENAGDENNAWATYQWATEAYSFLNGNAGSFTGFSGLGADPRPSTERLKVKWPADVTAVRSDLTGFEVRRGDEAWAGRVMRPYTVVAVTRRLGGPQVWADWDDRFGQTLTAIMAQHLRHDWYRLCSSANPTYCGTYEDPPHASHTVGGMSEDVATVGTYWDLWDAAIGEDHDGNGSRDQVRVTLDLMWSVMRDYDPNPGDPNDNHPSNIYEFGRGLLARLPAADAPRVRMVFDENHLVLP